MFARAVCSFLFALKLNDWFQLSQETKLLVVYRYRTVFPSTVTRDISDQDFRISCPDV